MYRTTKGEVAGWEYGMEWKTWETRSELVRHFNFNKPRKGVMGGM